MTDMTDRDLVLTRWIDAPPAAVYRAWTDPALLESWFAPPPYSVAHVDVDVRPGGTSLIVMRAPDGTEIPSLGVYLEVVANARLVSTDAYRGAWVSADKPFMTLILTFVEEAGGTRYTATARHWSVADRMAHEAMGFQHGWNICTDQLAALLARTDPPTSQVA